LGCIVHYLKERTSQIGGEGECPQNEGLKGKGVRRTPSLNWAGKKKGQPLLQFSGGKCKEGQNNEGGNEKTWGEEIDVLELTGKTNLRKRTTGKKAQRDQGGGGGSRPRKVGKRGIWM